MSSRNRLPFIALGRYRHCKGGEYDVIGVARYSQTHEALVVCRPLYNATDWWKRPHAVFFKAVAADGLCRARFEKAGSDAAQQREILVSQQTKVIHDRRLPAPARRPLRTPAKAR